MLEDDVARSAEHPVIEASGVQLPEGHAPSGLNMFEASDVACGEPLFKPPKGRVEAVVVVHSEGEPT